MARRTKRAAWFLAVCGVVLMPAALLPADARAMTVPAMSPTELAARAALVVEGRVVSAEARWVGTRVITFYVVVGACPTCGGAARALRHVVVAVPGGVVGSLAQRVPGAPVLDVGRSYRLYLSAATGPQLDEATPTHGIVGFWRGVFSLDDDGAGAVPFTESGRPAEVVR